MKKNIAICIQVRSNSKRLKNKCFRVIKKKILLQHCYERLKNISKSIPIYVLTTKLRSDNKIVIFCRKNKINYYRGNNINVLNRYVSFIKKYKFKNIVRVTADNIFTDINRAKKLIKIHLKKNNDFTTNHLSSLPKGTGLDIFRYKALSEINNIKLKKDYKEHISKFFLSKKNFFKVNKVSALKKKNNLNLSIDNLSNFNFIKKNFKYLQKIKNFSNIKKNF